MELGKHFDLHYNGTDTCYIIILQYQFGGKQTIVILCTLEIGSKDCAFFVQKIDLYSCKWTPTAKIGGKLQKLGPKYNFTERNF